MTHPLRELVGRLRAARGSQGGSAIYDDETAIVDATAAIESLLDEVEGLRAIKTAAQAVKAQGTLPQGRLRSSKCVIPASSWHQLCVALSSDAGER